MKRIILGILLIIWASTIFMFSHQGGEQSSGTSQGTVRIVLENIIPKYLTENEKEEIIQKIEPFVRKLAHYAIYMIGGILLYSFMNTFSMTMKRSFLFSQIIGTGYAITDEWHQYFIPGRSAQISDILLDAVGVLTGIILVILLQKLSSKINDRKRGKKLEENQGNS